MILVSQIAAEGGVILPTYESDIWVNMIPAYPLILGVVWLTIATIFHTKYDTNVTWMLLSIPIMFTSFFLIPLTESGTTEWNEENVKILNEGYPGVEFTVQNLEDANLADHVGSGKPTQRVFQDHEAILDPETGEWVEQTRSFLIDGNVVKFLEQKQPIEETGNREVKQ